MPDMILPGVYIQVNNEGLITTAPIATGNIGIVGTANKGPLNEVVLLSTFTEAREVFGWEEDELTLLPALKHVFGNGGRKVYAVRASASDGSGESLAEFAKPTEDNYTNFQAKSPGTWGNEIEFKIEDITPDPLPSPLVNHDTRKISIRLGSTEETFIFTSASPNEQIESFNAFSNLIQISPFDPDHEDDTWPMELLEKTDNADSTPLNWLKLKGGNNGENISNPDDFLSALNAIKYETINLITVAGAQADSPGYQALQTHITETSQIQRERIGIVGSSDSSDSSALAGEATIVANDQGRLIFVTPGLSNGQSGAYTAAAVTGLIASLPFNVSPTNKVLNVPGLVTNFTPPRLEQLLGKNALVIEKRDGYRITKGITRSTNSAWHQITTRRIIDYAIYGVRSACSPYIGKLNNQRVRAAMKSTLDGFLTRMVDDEALISYELEVSATRAQEIAGIAMVNMTLRPTFSIDFVRVTMNLQ